MTGFFPSLNLQIRSDEQLGHVSLMSPQKKNKQLVLIQINHKLIYHERSTHKAMRESKLNVRVWAIL